MLFATYPEVVISTARLDLVPLSPSHAEEMAVVLADPELHRFIGGAPLSAAELLTRYERLAAGSPDPAVRWLNWVIRERATGALTGTAQATITGDVAEIAWVVGTAWQGRGIAAEAATGLVGWLSGQVDTVIAHVHPDHAASAAVARRAGLESTGEFHDGEIRWQLRR